MKASQTQERDVRAEPDEQVDIAVVRGIPPGNRTEHPHTFSTVPVGFGQDLSAMPGENTYGSWHWSQIVAEIEPGRMKDVQ